MKTIKIYGSTVDDKTLHSVVDILKDGGIVIYPTDTVQLVYFNDLHKNLGCNMGRTAKISIIPVTFTVLPVIFYALPPPAALFFSHSLPPPSSNCPV